MKFLLSLALYQTCMTFFIPWNTKRDFRQNETLGHHSSSLHLGLYNECEYGLRLTFFAPHIMTEKWNEKCGWEDNRSFIFCRTITINHDHLVKFRYFHLGVYILLTFVNIIYILRSSDLVQPKEMNILSSFTHPRVVSNQYDFFLVKHKIKTTLCRMLQSKISSGHKNIFVKIFHR